METINEYSRKVHHDYSNHEALVREVSTRCVLDQKIRSASPAKMARRRSRQHICTGRFRRWKIATASKIQGHPPSHCPHGVHRGAGSLRESSPERQCEYARKRDATCTRVTFLGSGKNQRSHLSVAVPTQAMQGQGHPFGRGQPSSRQRRNQNSPLHGRLAQSL